MLKRAGQILVWLILALFLAALARIVSFRLGTGEVYPEYSTLRPDPLGAKALFVSLGKLEGKSITRHLGAIQRLKAGERATVLFLGARNLVDPGALMRIGNMAREGGRVVVALNAARSFSEEREEDRINRIPIKRTEPAKSGEPESAPLAIGLPKIALIDPLRLQKEQLLAHRAMDREDLPDAISWYGRYCFEWSTTDWETVFAVKEKPVVIQRQLGLGTLVLCADSFPFSNEALARERATSFLLWVLGGRNQIVFVESHLGVQHGSSIMLLLREFRLQGLFFGLLLVAGLWIWKSIFSFVPAHSSGEISEAIQGKTTREGVLHLLERNIPAEQLPAICLAEWRKSHPDLNPFDAARYAEAEAVVADYKQLASGARNPVKAYHEITNILSK